ncbi:MAG: hypothetical protein QFX34_04765 [Candidatus Verstraetearchaeota archaeon]|nr:hypothetical protein [Candidatus Verstraetearchaeota archaeon]
MWWVIPGFVVGMVTSGFMMAYLHSRLRSAMAEKGWRFMSMVWVLV